MASKKVMWLYKFHIRWSILLWIQFYLSYSVTCKYKKHKDIILCNNLQHSSLRPSHMTTGRTVFTAAPVFYKSPSTSLSLLYSSYYLLTTLKRLISHLINILLKAQPATESDQQQWSDKIMSLHTHGEYKHKAKPTEGTSTPQYNKKNMLWIWPSEVWFPSHGHPKIKENAWCPPWTSTQKAASLNSDCLTHWKISGVTWINSNPCTAARPECHRLLQHKQ